MRRIPAPRRERVIRAGFTVSVVLLAAGCGTISPERPHAPELKTLRVAVTKSIDTVPLRLGVERGFFREAGLDVQLVEAGSTAVTMRAVVEGTADIGLTCNFALLRKTVEGARFELQGEAYISGQNTMALVTLPGHGYDEPTDKPDPVIGVEPNRGLGKLATRMRLATEGVDPAKVRFTELQFAGMIAALEDDRIDAAWMTEPDISRAQKEYGAAIVVDTARGALQEFPLTTYSARSTRAVRNPHTYASFRQALYRSQALANEPSMVRAELSELTSLDKTTVELVAIGSYPTSLNGVRLQRVADLMHSAGSIPERIDVASMLPQPPAT